MRKLEILSIEIEKAMQAYRDALSKTKLGCGVNRKEIFKASRQLDARLAVATMRAKFNKESK